MASVDLIQIIGNLGQSLYAVQGLISGFAYLIGIVFYIKALNKLMIIGDYRAMGQSSERMFVPIAYLLAGSALFFLPTAVGTLANTAFGTGNVLQYAQFSPYDITTSMPLLIRTAGLIWFVRGCVLLAQASEPGVQHGPKGLVFLCAGVLAFNYETTVSTINSILESFIAYTLALKASQGY